MKQLILLSLFLFTTNLFSQVPTYVPKNGLLGWWGFNGNANDESGNGNHGVVSGAVLSTDKNDQTQKAYNFDGQTNYITINNKDSFIIQDSITISLWIYMLGGSGNPRIIQFGNDNLNEYGIETQGSSDSSRVVNGYFGGFPANAELSSQTWHHVLYTCNRISGISRIYFDGKLASEFKGTPNTSLSYALCDLTIGRKPCNNSDYYGGKIDDIGIWNRELNQDEVAGLFKSTTTTNITEDVNTLSQFLVYPNPTNSYVIIDCGDQAEVSAYSFVITNSLGQEKVSSKFTTRFQQIDISGIGGAGLYMISIRDGSNAVIETRKLLIQ